MKTEGTKELKTTKRYVEFVHKEGSKYELEDYKALLEKYIEYLVDIEGSDFIKNDKLHLSDIKFTTEEWGILEQMSFNIFVKNSRT